MYVATSRFCHVLGRVSHAASRSGSTDVTPATGVTAPRGFEPVPIGKVPSRAVIGYRTPTLDLLLAALIDNTTGGANAVNGTLESVTYQIGFLGLNAAVVNAISNATEPIDGL
jgi:hypothetical protein